MDLYSYLFSLLLPFTSLADEGEKRRRKRSKKIVWPARRNLSKILSFGHYFTWNKRPRLEAKTLKIMPV